MSHYTMYLFSCMKCFVKVRILSLIGNETLGHPKVYINLDKPEINVCGYCGKRFVATQHKHLFPNEQFEEYTSVD